MDNFKLHDFGNRLFLNQKGHQPELIEVYNLVFDHGDDLLTDYRSSKRNDLAVAATIMPMMLDMIQLMIKLPTWSLVCNVVTAFGNCFKVLQYKFIEALNVSFDLPDKTKVVGYDLDFIKGVAVGLLSLIDENLQPVMRISSNSFAWELLHQLCSIKLDGKNIVSIIKDDKDYMGLLNSEIRKAFGDKKLSSAEKIVFKKNFYFFKDCELNLVGEAFISELFYAIAKSTDGNEKINLLLNI